MKVSVFAKIKAFVKKLFLPITKSVQWLIKTFSVKKPAPQTAPPQEPKLNKILNVLPKIAKASKNPLANITSFLATKVLPKFKKIIIGFLKKPAASIIAGAGIFASSSLLPASSPFVLILRGTGITTSGIGFLRSFPKQINKAFNSYKIAGSIGRAANTFSTFLTGLTTVSIASPTWLPAVCVGLAVLLPIVLTLFIVITSSAAFLPEGVGETSTYIGTPVEPRAQATELAEKVIYVLNQCGITQINKATWLSTKLCLETSNLPNYELIIQQFDYSVNQVGPGLQCVGFVRGIMAALEKPLEGGKTAARDYLNPPPPTGYAPVNSNMDQVKIGDLVIMAGSTYGHIAIVIDKIGDQIRVAEAIGTKNGIIQIEDINPIYYDGFLRPL